MAVSNIHEMVAYEDVKVAFEKEGCKLLTTKDEMESLRLGTTSKYKIMASCGHQIDGCWFHMFKYRGTGKICKACMDAKQSIHRKAVNDTFVGDSPFTHDIEKQGIDLIKKYAGKDVNIEVSPECCLADIAIKHVTGSEDKWLPIQLKCTLEGRHNVYSFGFKGSTYKDMYILFVCIKEEKFWILDGNKVDNKKKLSIGMQKSMYNQYNVSKDDLGNKLSALYNSSGSSYIKPLVDIQTPITLKCQKEQQFRKLRESKLQGVPFQQPESGHTVYDFKVNGYKVQEKTTGTYKKKSERVTFHKRYKGLHNQPYHENDNDFYWVHSVDMQHFYVFPNNVMVKHGIISQSDGSVGKKNLIFSKTNTWVNEYKYNYNDVDVVDKMLKLFSID